jgi:hypothetical protein
MTGQQSEQVLPQALVSVAVKLQHAAVVHICGAGGKGEAGGEEGRGRQVRQGPVNPCRCLKAAKQHLYTYLQEQDGKHTGGSGSGQLRWNCAAGKSGRGTHLKWRCRGGPPLE